MTGSIPFSIEKSDNFARSFKKLAKTHGKVLVEIVTENLERLTENPYPYNSRQEPLPGKTRIHLIAYPKGGDEMNASERTIAPAH